MNYYIDFDNTLYNSSLLEEKMLNLIVETACAQKEFDKKSLFDECKSIFNREHIYDIYKLVDYLSNKYTLDKNPIIASLNHLILNSNDLVFNDCVEFFKKLHEQNHNIYLFTHSISNKYQAAKILGSGLADFFDGIFITSKPKYELNIDYANGIFIDDNPEDLLGLYSKNVKKLIRLRRERK